MRKYDNIYIHYVTYQKNGTFTKIIKQIILGNPKSTTLFNIFQII